MADYIERDAVVDLIARRYENPEICTQEINSIPAADVAPVVRCNVCRSYNKPRAGWCEVHLDREHPDDFCSYGKYQTNGGADNA